MPSQIRNLVVKIGAFEGEYGEAAGGELEDGSREESSEEEREVGEFIDECVVGGGYELGESIEEEHDVADLEILECLMIDLISDADSKLILDGVAQKSLPTSNLVHHLLNYYDAILLLNKSNLNRTIRNRYLQIIISNPNSHYNPSQ